MHPLRRFGAAEDLIMESHATSRELQIGGTSANDHSSAFPGGDKV